MFLFMSMPWGIDPKDVIFWLEDNDYINLILPWLWFEEAYVFLELASIIFTYLIVGLDLMSTVNMLNKIRWHTSPYWPPTIYAVFKFFRYLKY